jgi:hypothetical protein
MQYSSASKSLARTRISGLEAKFLFGFLKLLVCVKRPARLSGLGKLKAKANGQTKFVHFVVAAGNCAAGTLNVMTKRWALSVAYALQLFERAAFVDDFWFAEADT